MRTIKSIFILCASLAFLAVFSLAVMLHVQVNADALFPFSIAKDVLTQVSIRHWHYPGPLFLIPDILISLPIVMLVKTPLLWASIFSFMQLLAFILLIVAFSKDKKNLPFRVIFTGCIYLTVIIYFIGRLLFHIAWTMIADKSAIPVHHVSGALAALLLFFLTFPKALSHVSLKKIIFIVCFMFLMSFSDPYFDYYFFMLMVPYLFIERLKLLQFKRWIGTMMGLGIAGIAGILLNGFLNPGLWIEFHVSHIHPSHTQSTLHNVLENISSFYHTMGWTGIVVIFIVPLLLCFLALKNKKKYLLSLFISMELISIGCLLLGMLNGDISFLRYIDIYFPIIVYATTELIPIRFFKFTQTVFVGLVAIVIAFFYSHSHFKQLSVMMFPQEFHSVLSCPDLPKKMPYTVLIATYWPAKVLFESGNRTTSMIEINPDMTLYPWIYNPAWQTIVKYPTAALISTYQLAPAKVTALSALPNAETVCHGQLIYVPFESKLFKLAPILKKYES